MSVDAMSLERLNLPAITEVPDTETYLAPSRSLDEELKEESDNGDAKQLDGEDSGLEIDNDGNLDEHNAEGERDLRSAPGTQKPDGGRQKSGDSEGSQEHVSELDAADETGVTKGQKLAAFENMQQEYARDRVGFMQRLLANLNPQEAAALGIAPEVQHQEIDLATKYPDLTEQEAVVEHHRQAITSLPAFQTATANWQNQAADVITTHAQHLTDVLYENAALHSELSAIKEALGVKLPAADRKAIEAEVRKGKTYREAFGAIHTPEAVKAAKVSKAAQAAVPHTPPDSSAATAPKLDKTASMYDIFKATEREINARNRAR